MSETLFIVAGNYVEANTWARERAMSPREYVYVSDAERIKGHRRKKYVLIGTFDNHPEYHRIMQELRIMEFSDVTGMI